MSEWVKIADREPDRLTYVLLWAKGWPVAWLGWSDVTGNYRLTGVSRMLSQSSDDHQPTHWHPLPEVPRE